MFLCKHALAKRRLCSWCARHALYRRYVCRARTNACQYVCVVGCKLFTTIQAHGRSHERSAYAPTQQSAWFLRQQFIRSTLAPDGVWACENFVQSLCRSQTKQFGRSSAPPVWQHARTHAHILRTCCPFPPKLFIHWEFQMGRDKTHKQ